LDNLRQNCTESFQGFYVMPRFDLALSSVEEARAWDGNQEGDRLDMTG